MSHNHLEQLVAEWYEFNGYFIRRNVLVGPLEKGGFECELDVVAFNPEKKHLVHIEPSMDANSWVGRDERYCKKFKAGKKYIPDLFKGLEILKQIEQIALLGFAGKNENYKTCGGGKVVLVRELLEEILKSVRSKSEKKYQAIPEQFPLLRTLQLVVDYPDVVKRNI